MRRNAIVLLLPFALSACAPPVVTLVSLTAGGLSYATTGKGLTDHALSEATQADCAMHRILHDQPVCSELPIETLAESGTEPPAQAKVFTAAGR